MSLFSILVNLEANTASLERGLDAAVKKISSFGDSVESAVKRAAGFAGLALTVDSFASSIQRAIASGDRLQLLSDRMGTSVANLSRLQYAAALTDIPVEALTSSFDHFHEVLGRAELGTGRAGKAIAAMGIDAKKLIDLPFDQQLEAIADKLSKIQNPAERAAYEMILFGEAGAKLDPLLRQGAAGIQRLSEEADKAGVTIDGQLTEKLKSAHEEMIKTDAVWNHASLTLAGALTPALQGAASLLDKFAGAISKAAAGWGVIVNGPANQHDQLNDLLTKRQDLLKSISSLEQESAKGGFLEHIFGDSTNYLAQQKQSLVQVEAQINSLNTALLALDKTQSQAKPLGAFNIDRLDLSALTGVQVNAQKIYTDKMLELLDSYQRGTQTDLEKTSDSWYKFEAELNELRSEGLISQEEYTKRLSAQLDEILPGVDIKEKLRKPVEEQLDEMQKLGEKTAASLQSAFAQFLFEPFRGGAKKMARDFLESLHRMLADAAAADIFSAFGEKGAKGTNSGLGGLLGGALDSLFHTGRAIQPPGPNAADKAGVTVAGQAGGFLGKWLGSLFSGGGDSGLASLADSGANAAIAAGNTSIGADLAGSIASMAVPALADALADGGTVSAGSSYLVGEEGPELFTAASHGVITPNDQLGGDTNITTGDTHMHFHGGDSDGLVRAMPGILAAHAARVKSDLLLAFRRQGLPTPNRA